MPNNSGAVDITPTRRVLHLQYIDSDEGVRTDSYDIPVATTDAALNALTAALGLTTNASLWNVGYTNWFATGQPQTTDADDLTNDSIKDNVVMLFKNATNLAFDFFIPANLEPATMIAGTENVDKTNPLIADVVTAVEAIWGGYAVVSYRFTQRRKKNRSTRA